MTELPAGGPRGPTPAHTMMADLFDVVTLCAANSAVRVTQVRLRNTLRACAACQQFSIDGTQFTESAANRLQ
jgi:hypothetical protein